MAATAPGLAAQALCRHAWRREQWWKWKYQCRGGSGGALSNALGFAGGTGGAQGNAGGNAGAASGPSVSEGGVQVVNALPNALTGRLLSGALQRVVAAVAVAAQEPQLARRWRWRRRGVVMIAARSFSGTGTIQANGGNGTSGPSGGGGGGGGCVIIVTTSAFLGASI